MCAIVDGPIGVVTLVELGSDAGRTVSQERSKIEKFMEDGERSGSLADRAVEMVITHGSSQTLPWQGYE